jgi:hypothetical protein
MNPNYTKEQRRRLRELGGLAYERELSDELGKLEGSFEKWRIDEIDAFELAEMIHRFHQGPARELFSKYDHSTVDLAVAQAIHRGLLSHEEAGADVIELLGSHLAFLRERNGRSAAQPGIAADDRLPRSARSPARR